MDHTLMFASGLFTNKDEQTYTYFLTEIKQRIHVLTGIVWAPIRAVIDFEVAAKNAILAVFPGIDIDGCFFHFCKAIFRNVQPKGLAVAYRDEDDFRQIIRMLMGLAFIPLAFVRNQYNIIRHDPATIQMIAVHPRLLELLTYFQRQWLNPNGSFPPVIWNFYTRPMAIRTNNKVESYYKRSGLILIIFETKLDP